MALVAPAYPKVLLVGRTNVGKSTLFNRLAEERRSMVFDREGVTRDYVQEDVTWDGHTFSLIDTGGLVFHRASDAITKTVQEIVIKLLDEAGIILFVVDGKCGLLDEDRKIAQTLRKTNKPVFVLVNKADNNNALEENMPEFFSLGFKQIIPVSGIHGIGIGALLRAIVAALPVHETFVAVTPSYNVAIIGRPNAGKSSLMNLLIQHERSIVSDVAGTTREPVTAMTYHLNDLIQFTDTAGVRRSRKIDDDLEGLMVKSSLAAVRDANIVVMMIDVSEGKIADQELKLLFYAYEQRKMLIVVFNKTDLLDEYTRQTIQQSVDEYEFILKKVPQVWVSCATKRNVIKIFAEIQNVWRRSQQEFDQVHVDELLKRELLTKHLYHNELQLKVTHVVPMKNATVPTFFLHVNFPEFFGKSELNCVENILRRNYDLLGCPVRLATKEG